MYPVITDPPFDDGAVKETVATPDELLVAVIDVGAPGTVAGVTAKDDVEASDVLTPLLAVTAKV
jgi:hypothetical protein